MNIKFLKLYIQSFQSIGKAEIDLENKGIVTIVGINNHENNAKSNGSGKTSIPASLFWCLYGKTPEGIINPTNRYSNERCQVSVDFEVDNSKYIVERNVNKSTQSVSLYINGELQSARNKSDSDKIIREDILKMSPDIFLSLIYLSQGFNSRLSSLTPAARKDRLEQLTNTAELIDKFSKRVSDGKVDLSTKCNKLQMEMSQCNGSIATYEKMISDYETRIAKAQDVDVSFEYQGKTYTYEDIDNLQLRLSQIKDALDSLMQTKLQINTALTKINAEIESRKREKAQALQRLEEVNSHIDHIENGSICPTCKQHIDENNKQELLDKYNNEKQILNERIGVINLEIDNYESQYKENKSALSECQEKESECRKRIDTLSYIIRNIPPKNELDIHQIRNDIESCKNKIAEITSNVETINSKFIETNNMLDVLNHCQQLVTKPFRAYLLKSALDFLNSRLLEYSKYLFSNESDIICLTTDSQKLDILLGDCDYSTLSGGEKRRVDLSVMLAQRDLATEIAGMTSNIIILDEIMESMDETATQTTLDLLENQSQTANSLESMFIISHNDYAIPVDSRIVVEKGVDRISKVIQY